MPQLPYQVPVTSNLIVADYAVKTVSTPACTQAGGTVIAAIGPVDQGIDYAWLVDNIVVQCTSSSQTALAVFIGDSQTDTYVVDLVAGSNSGNLDFDDVAGIGLLVQASQYVTFQWVGCSVGAVGTARLQYRRLRQE